MELRKICDDTGDMGMWELAHNMMFVKDREAWYRDFEREIPLLDLVREIYEKHAGEDGLTQDMRSLTAKRSTKSSRTTYSTGRTTGTELSPCSTKRHGVRQSFGNG